MAAAMKAPSLHFNSLTEALDAPRSVFFGITPEGQPRDPRTHYRPDTPYLTFDISNGAIFCCISPTGLIRNPGITTAVRSVPKGTRGLTGKYRESQRMGGSPLPFGIDMNGAEATNLHEQPQVSAEFLGAFFPMFTYRHGALRARLLAFAPSAPSCPRGIVIVLHLTNEGSGTALGSVLAPQNVPELAQVGTASTVAAPAENRHPLYREDALPLQPGHEAILCLDGTSWSPGFPHVRFALESGESAVFCFGYVLGENAEEVAETGRVVADHSALEWLNDSWLARVDCLGQLSIPEDPYYAESFVRLAEQSGRWSIFAARPPRIRSSYLDNVPPEPYGRGLDRFPNPSRVTHSLTNASLDLVAAGTYYQMTGDRAFFQDNPEFLPAARELLQEVLASRRGEPFLFPSMYIWDGDSRGDYHTGSNLLVWYAFHSAARIARDAYGDQQSADEWAAIADKIRAAMLRHCVVDGPLGPQFVEGANADGTFVAGHDGEEAFTNLMPIYGFCEPDDAALLRHARLALSPLNPLYAPGVDGIWWLDGEWWGGATFPGWMTGLAGAAEEREVLFRLEQIRRLTDLDGSLWWWPYDYGCTDLTAVRRERVYGRTADGRPEGVNLAKCPYAAGLYISLFVSKVLGLRVDVPERRVWFRPFVPWPEFTWKGCRLGQARFDVAFRHRDGRIAAEIANQNEEPFEAAVELMLPYANRPTECRLNGVATEDFERAEYYNRPSVRFAGTVEPGCALQVQTSYVACTQGQRAHQ